MAKRQAQPAWPWAALQQPVRDHIDFLLTEQARAGVRTIAWWWGKRQKDGKAGAYCYLCDDWIVSWDVRWPMTDTAKRIVDEHRKHHIEMNRRD